MMLRNLSSNQIESSDLVQLVWPFTMRIKMTRKDSLNEVAKQEGARAQTMTTEL